jgi:hypothetical protein
MGTETLKSVYFAYFQTIMPYGTTFWRNSMYRKSILIQNRIIGIIARTTRRGSCRKLFKKFNVLPLASKLLLIIIIYSGQHEKISN